MDHGQSVSSIECIQERCNLRHDEGLGTSRTRFLREDVPVRLDAAANAAVSPCKEEHLPPPPRFIIGQVTWDFQGSRCGAVEVIEGDANEVVHVLVPEESDQRNRENILPAKSKSLFSMN